MFERGRVMFRHVQAVDAGVVGRLGKGQPFIEQRGERPVAMLDVIKQSDFHCCCKLLPASRARRSMQCCAADPGSSQPLKVPGLHRSGPLRCARDTRVHFNLCEAFLTRSRPA
jgi:hypothetical protein